MVSIRARPPGSSSSSPGSKRSASGVRSSPGDRLVLECRLIRHKLKLWKMEGRAYVDGVLAAEAEITAAVTDRGDM